MLAGNGAGCERLKRRLVAGVALALCTAGAALIAAEAPQETAPVKARLGVARGYGLCKR